jgi:hypothetical protein
MNRFLGILSTALGFLGIVACLAAGYGSWRAADEARDGNRRLCEAGRTGLIAVQDRIRRVDERIDAARLEGEEVSRWIRELTKQEARERIAEQVQIESRVDRITSKMTVADDWLESANETLALAQKILKLGRTREAGANAERISEITGAIDEVRTELSSVQQQLLVVRNFGKEVDGEHLDERIARVVRILTAILAATRLLDSRLEQCQDRLLDLREQTLSWEHKIDAAIRRALAIVALVLAWMAAGQWCLFRSGLRRLRRAGRRSPEG